MKILAAFLLLLSTLAYSYETDQYSSLGVEIKDSEEVLNGLVNRVIHFTAENWSGEQNSYKFAMDVVRFLNNRQLERFANIDPQIGHYNPRKDSIYQYVSAAVSPIIRYKLLASSININGVHMGADKMSHFFGVGSMLFTDYTEELGNDGLEYGELDRAALDEALDHSVFTEYAYWGMATTGVYSNADLVVNYEGFRFLLSMFVDNVVEGKKAIIRWDGNTPIVQGEFDFSDFVNDYWSEALNPNRLKYGLHGKVLLALQKKCLDGSINEGTVLRSPIDEELNERYAELLGLTPNRYTLLMDNVCANVKSWNSTQLRGFKKEIAELDKEFAKIDRVAPTDEPELDDLISGTMWVCRGDKKKAENEHQMMMYYDGISSERIIGVLKDSLASSESNKLCETMPVELIYSDNPVRRGDIDLAIHYCVERDSDGNINESKYYSVEKDGNTLYSMEGYINFVDAKAYVLRTTNKNCNWY